MHRTCAEYRNKNQTRNARCEAALNVSPQQPAIASTPQKLKFHRALIFKIQKFYMDLKVIYAKFQGNQFINELARTL